MSAPNPQSLLWAPEFCQLAFLNSPVFETLFTGPRGSGKTDALLMSYAKNVNRGYGASWRGIIFRQTVPQLRDVIAKSMRWFKQAFPRATFNQQDKFWTFPTGETLYLKHINDLIDYWDYHGHEYPFIGFEELANWPVPDLYLQMMSCCRATDPTMPRMYRGTTNPYGPGAQWIAERFQLPAMLDRIIKGRETAMNGVKVRERDRLAIHGEYLKILRDNDPDYLASVIAAADSEAKRAAWLEGRWGVSVGGMFDDLWDPRIHVLPTFRIPSTWRIRRSFDWGASKPYSIGWWAISDGSELELPDGSKFPTLPGDHFRVAELYGWTGKANEGVRETPTQIAIQGRDRERVLFGLRSRVEPGPADSMIFYSDPGIPSVASQLELEGLPFTRASKGPGSRVAAWQKLRGMLGEARKGPLRERPALFVTDSCRQFIRTIPGIPRCPKNPDDIDTNCEDHIADETGYMLLDVDHRMHVRGLWG